MGIDFSNAPYYDDYDPEKGYTKIVALPGRVEQAREFTQIQTMYLDFLKRLGDSLFFDGAIIDGCSITIKDKVVTISEGKVYLGGLVRKVPSSTLEIVGVGSEVIGVRLKQEIITEAEDPTLRDPAQGYDNYGQSGAHRLKESVEVVLDDPFAAPLYRLQDGSLLSVIEEKPQLDQIIELLARRTYDEVGNYKVEGLDLFDINESTEDKVLVSIEPGRAYVRGYEVNKPMPIRIALDKALDTRTVSNEPKVYTRPSDTYRLNNAPLNRIQSLMAMVEVTRNITRGNIGGGLDYLPFSPVVQVLEVRQGDTVYTQGVDYQVVGDAIDWSLSGIEPSIGSSYQVIWRYNRLMKLGENFDLETDENGHASIKFIGDILPVVGSTFLVTYDFFLYRRDLVCIDRYGQPFVVKGQSDILSQVFTPIFNNDDYFKLGSVLIYPNSDKIEILNYSVTKISNEYLYDLVNRIEDIEYNQAISSLDEEAMEGEPATDLKGILTDGFIGFSKADVHHPDYTAAMDIERGELTLPSRYDIKLPVIRTGVGGSSIYLGSRLITTPFREVLHLDQNTATEAMLVNPYAVFNKTAILKINPAVDNWVDQEIMTIDKEEIETIRVSRWYLRGGSLWSHSESQKWADMGFTVQTWGGGWGEVTGEAVTNVSTSSRTILDEAITYMRQIEITVEGENFLPFSDNLICTFDGIRVPLIPASEDYRGTEEGTAKADSKGYFKAKFKIPSKVRTGTRQIIVYNPINTAETSFTSQGRRRVIERTVIRTVTRAVPYDPLAQSFQFNEDRMLTSVGLYFGTKDPNLPIIIQVRDMVNGYPGTTCYAEEILYPQDVLVSEEGTLETRVRFSDPVFCRANTQYCIAIISDSNLYSMFVSTLGQRDLITGNYVSRQPYVAGVLFSSSNAITWTAHQTKDLKFRLYVAEFEEEGIIIFEDITGEEMDKLVLAADYLTPANTGCEWEIKIGNGDWLPLTSFEEREFSEAISDISLRARLLATSSSSPILATDCTNLVTFLEDLEASYITRNVVLDQPFTQVKQVLDINTPPGTSVTVKFAIDTDGNEWITPNQTMVQPIDQDFSRFTFTYELPQPAINFRGRIDLSSDNYGKRPRVRRFMNIIK